MPESTDRRAMPNKRMQADALERRARLIARRGVVDLVLVNGGDRMSEDEKYGTPKLTFDEVVARFSDPRMQAPSGKFNCLNRLVGLSGREIEVGHTTYQLRQLFSETGLAEERTRADGNKVFRLTADGQRFADVYRTRKG